MAILNQTQKLSDLLRRNPKFRAERRQEKIRNERVKSNPACPAQTQANILKNEAIAQSEAKNQVALEQRAWELLEEEITPRPAKPVERRHDVGGRTVILRRASSPR